MNTINVIVDYIHDNFDNLTRKETHKLVENFIKNDIKIYVAEVADVLDEKIDNMYHPDAVNKLMELAIKNSTVYTLSEFEGRFNAGNIDDNTNFIHIEIPIHKSFFKKDKHDLPGVSESEGS